MSKIAKAILIFLLLFLVSFLIPFLWTVPAKADTEGPTMTTGYVMACGDHADLVGQLKVRHKEVSVGMGLVRDKENILELFVSPQGTWSLLSTFIRGENRTCLVASGTAWMGEAPQSHSLLIPLGSVANN